MTKINACSYLNPCSKEYSDTNEKFKKLSGDKKFLVVLATFFAGVASFFMGGLGGLAAYRQLVNKFSEIKKDELEKNPTAEKTDGVSDETLTSKKEKKKRTEQILKELEKRHAEDYKKEKLAFEEEVRKEKQEISQIQPLRNYEWVRNFIDIKKFFKNDPSNELIQNLAKSTLWKLFRDEEDRLIIVDLVSNCPESKIGLITSAVADSPKHLRAIMEHLFSQYVLYSPESEFPASETKEQSFKESKDTLIAIFGILTEKQKMAFITVDPSYYKGEKMEAEMAIKYCLPHLKALKSELKLTEEFMAALQAFESNH